MNLEIAILSLHLHSDSYESSARMAESVDALVSNTNDREIVPVRSRLRVPKTPVNQLIDRDFNFAEGRNRDDH